jgi:hypothetical protein
MRYLFAAALIALATFSVFPSLTVGHGIGIFVGELLGFVIIFPALIAGLSCIPKAARNSKRFFLVFNIVLALTIVGNSGSLLAHLDKSTQVLTAPNGSAHITIPSDWSNEKVPNNNTLFYVINESNLLRIIVNFDPVEDDTVDLATYADFMGNQYKNGVPDFESISEINSCDYNTFNCAYQIINTTTGDKGTSTVLASLEGNGGFYNFMAITNPGLLEMYENDIFNVIKSFNLPAK